MSYSKYQLKTDANDSDITKYLRSHGLYVKQLPPTLTDKLTVNSRAEVGFMEIKVEGSKAKFTRIQLEFIANCPANVAICKTRESALQFAQNPKECGLTRRQKDALAFFLQKQPKDKKYFQPSEIEEILK